MVKILHTGDIHLGKPFRRLGTNAAAATARVAQAFSALCERAISSHCDALIIAGDLFDSNRVSAREISLALKELQRVGDAGIHTIVIAGTHDRLEDEHNAVLLRNEFLNIPRFHVLRGESYQLDLPEISLTVCGHSNIFNKSTESPLEKIHPKNGQKYAVGVVHASVAIEGKYAKDDYPITVEEISASPFSYVALGHWHRAQEVVPGKAWYAGSPEVLSLQEEGAGFVILVEMNEAGTTIAKEGVGAISFDTKDIEVGGDTTQEMLLQKISEGAHDCLIRTVTLRGVMAPDAFFDLRALREALESQFFALKILDKTTVSLDDAALAKFPEELVIGQFVRMLKKEINEEVDSGKKKRLEKALQMGIALLQGREVL